MAYRERVDKRLRKKEQRYETEQLLKEKRSEEYQVLEEVFDKSTLMTIYEFLNKGYHFGKISIDSIRSFNTDFIVSEV